MSIITAFAMFIDIQAFFFNTCFYPKAVQFSNAEKQGESTSSRPNVDAEDSKTFCSEKSPAVTIECTVTDREQPCHQSAKYSANTMNGRGTDWVIDVQTMVDELNRIYQSDATNQSNDDRPYG